MLAVLPEFRNGGLGRRLKLAQRDLAMEQNIDCIEWTFDPLEIKNSFFNLHRLGAISCRYEPDFYGPSSSPLQGGLQTDRLYAEWWLRAPRTGLILDDKRALQRVVARVRVPAEIYDWKRTGDPRARETQSSVRDALLQHFGKGLAVIDYERGEDGTGAFLLGPPPSPVPIERRKTL